MNTYVLKSINPKQLARLMSAIYGVLFLIICLIGVPMFMFVPTPPGTNQAFPKAFGLAFLVIYPIFGAFMGWVGGHIVARIYNFAAKRLGGVRVDVDKYDAVLSERNVA
jgi:hypothetical protein